MPSIKPQALDKEIMDGKLRPVYLLYGEETYLLDRAFKSLSEKALGDGLADFNYDMFHARDKTAAEVVSISNTLPMMADRRLVVLKGVDTWRKEEQTKLVPYLSDPSPTTCLILLASGVDKRRDWAKAAGKAGAIVEFKHPYMDRMHQQVRGMARGMGKNIDQQSASLLVELVGNDLMQLEQALNKLSLYMEDQVKITRELIVESVADVKMAGVFEFTDALGKKDLESALRTLTRMVESRETDVHFRILAMMLRHFRIIWRVSELKDQGEPPPAIAKQLGINPYILDKTYLGQASNFSSEELAKIFTKLSELDLKLKTGATSRASKPLVFERVVVELCR